MKRLFLPLMLTACSLLSNAATTIDDLGITTSKQREYSFSDKNAGFFYGMTNTDNFKEFYAGWNIEAHRIFSDYTITVNGKPLSKETAKTTVYPNRLERIYADGTTETLYLVDGKKIIFIDINNTNGALGLKLKGENLPEPIISGGNANYQFKDLQNRVLAVCTPDAPCQIKDGIIETDSKKGFIITFGTQEINGILISEAKKDKEQLLNSRKERLQQLVDSNRTDCNSEDASKALHWLRLTADELVTNQHGGWGIYAGFPWFTDFWGRDMFIAMPGTSLCSGQFDIAKDILQSFAKYMDTDPKSETYGRVPNRLNLEGILYNTTDGTPRFVIQVYDYLKYTGDKEFIKSIYKNIKMATDASIDKYADESGYLTHADADTWMDAKRQGKKPCSPRGNRAVDIQALWYEQLEAAAKLADYMGKKKDAEKWRGVAQKLQSNFEKDFIGNGIIADHLNEDNSRDTQLRPNTMYAYNLVSNDSVKMADIRTTWSHLVYPWGVSSLDQMDDQFHPYHEQWHRYHKDDAYHNGTVWLWQNGMAMQRMIEYGQKDKAYQLFRNMNLQALHIGAVGSLSECADPWCRPGKTIAKLSGTFLQSWSNSEQLRVWSQYFLGVRPNMLEKEITIAPRLPKDLQKISATVNIADGKIIYTATPEQAYNIEWTGTATTEFKFDLEGVKNFSTEMNKGDKISIEGLSTLTPTATVFNKDGKQIKSINLEANAEKIKFAKKCAEFFKNTDFAEPCYRENLKSMSRYFDPPLDYYSIE